LQLVSGSAGLIESTAPKAWSVTVNGTTYSGTNSVAIGNNTTKTLASGQTTIAHDNDGTKSFSYSFSQTFAITFAGVSIGTKTGNGTGTLNTIARATTPVPHITSIDMGQTLTIYTYRASTDFTHTLEYSFAGGTYQLIQNDVDTVAYWSVPTELAKSIPNTTSGTLTIKCTTKNGSAVVGTKTSLVTVKVPSTVKPTISAVTHTEAATGLPEGIGAYVQSKSKLKVSIVANGANGSTIKSYSSTILGKTYSGVSFTTDTLTLGGTLSIVTTVTDSRGRTETKTTDVTVLNYTPPQISNFHVTRYNTSGAPNPNGTRVGVTLAYSITTLNNKNTAAAKIEYKRSTDTTWSTLYNRTDVSMNTTLTPTTTFSTDYQYDIRMTLTDGFQASATYTAILPSGAVILDIKADGKGIAFFKTSTVDGVEIEAELPGSAKTLTTNTNLNDLNTPGYYFIPNASISASILNKPYTDSATASVKVEKTGNGSIRQIVQKASKTSGAIYERSHEGGTWGAWSTVYSGQGKLIWSGSSLLTASQTATFTEPISAQQSGIVLVFSRYASGTAQDYHYSCHFIPKVLIAQAIGIGQTAAGITVTMATNKFEYISGKYLRVTDTKITGDDANSASGTSNGITYNNGLFALRYIIGV
jgi:hypothetical protein